MLFSKFSSSSLLHCARDLGIAESRLYLSPRLFRLDRFPKNKRGLRKICFRSWEKGSPTGCIFLEKNQFLEFLFFSKHILSTIISLHILSRSVFSKDFPSTDANTGEGFRISTMSHFGVINLHYSALLSSLAAQQFSQSIHLSFFVSF